MNNTTKKRNLTAIAAILMAATIVVGGSLAATSVKSAFAASNNNSGNTVTAQINKQHGTQSGFDNDQEQEGQNTICTHPGENSTCVQEGAAVVVAPTPTPTPQNVMACVECFTSSLSQAQIGSLLAIFNLTSLEDLCAALENGTISAADLSRALVLQVVPTIGDAELSDLRECITAATGIELPPV